jgi:hypothetical protein
MAIKSLVGPSVLLAAWVALSGCQNTPPRQPANPGFVQKQGSPNPPVVGANQQPMQPNGAVMPAYNAAPGAGVSPPAVAPIGTGSQYRSTAPAPFINPSGPGPGAGFGTQNPTPPPLGPTAGPPGFDQPITPPQNPNFPR